jgi:hypothetical protein
MAKSQERGAKRSICSMPPALYALQVGTLELTASAGF